MSETYKKSYESSNNGKRNSKKLSSYNEEVGEPLKVVTEYVAEENAKAKGNFPKKKYKAGAITATVWENKGKDAKGLEHSYQTISLERVYQDREGQWKSTNSFRVNDLPKVNLLMSKVYEELVLKEQQLFRSS